jgi:hypothetical protein
MRSRDRRDTRDNKLIYAINQEQKKSARRGFQPSDSGLNVDGDFTQFLLRLDAIQVFFLSLPLAPETRAARCEFTMQMT